MATVRQSEALVKTLLIEAESEHINALCALYRSAYHDETLQSSVNYDDVLNAILEELARVTGHIYQLLGGE